MKSSAELGIEFRDAAAKNNIEALETLYTLKAGILNLTGPSTGLTALHQAALRGNTEAVKWLLERNADYLLEGKNELNAINIALREHQFNVFALFYNHLHKQKQPLFEPSSIFTNRTTRYTNKPLLIQCQKNQDAITQLNSLPGYIFSQYVALGISGVPESPSINTSVSIEQHDLNLELNHPAYHLSAEHQAHPDFIRLQHHHCALRIAELAEKYQGGVVVLVYNDLKPILTELHKLFPNTENLFEEFILPESGDTLAEQFSMLQLGDTIAQTNIDAIRKEAHDNVFQQYHWDNKDLFVAELNEALDQLDMNDENAAKADKELQQRLFSKTTPSMKDLTKSLELMKSLLEHKEHPKEANQSLQDLRNITKAYFEILERRHTQDEINIVRENIESIYRPFYLKVIKNQNTFSSSLILPTIFYLINRCDLFDSTNRELGDLQVGIYFVAARLKKEKSTEPYQHEMISYIIKQTHIQLRNIDNKYALLNEFAHYVHLKNYHYRKNHLPMHIEILNGWSNNQYNGKPVNWLYQKALEIKSGLQPRTQFIFFPIPYHSYVVDIDWDKQQSCFKIIMIDTFVPQTIQLDASKLTLQLNKHGFSSQYLLCTTTIQKDGVSCLAYSYAIASHISHLSFDELNQHPEIETKNDLQSNNQGIKWLPITAFGEKLILMGQSSVEMRNNLAQLYGKDSKKIEETIANWKKWYAYPGAQDSNKVDYIGYRQHSLYTKAMNKSHPSTRQILDMTKTDDLGFALRILASGQGPGRMLKQLLSQVSPMVINETGIKSKRGPLHFAYLNGKLSRAKHLLAHGADPELSDCHGLKPEELNAHKKTLAFKS